MVGRSEESLEGNGSFVGSEGEDLPSEGGERERRKTVSISF